jgi:hypothetical protein
MHDITRRVPGWPGMGPTPRTNHQAEGRATVQAELGQQEHYLNLKLQSKAEYSNTQQGLPGDGIHSHITRLMKSGNGQGVNFQLKSN